MSNQDQYIGPLLCVALTAENADGVALKYKWKVTMSAADHKGQRKLGYKACGLLADLDSSPGEFDIQVHDADRNVWTTMPLGDRKDIRARIGSLVVNAMTAVKSGGYA